MTHYSFLYFHQCRAFPQYLIVSCLFVCLFVRFVVLLFHDLCLLAYTHTKTPSKIFNTNECILLMTMFAPSTLVRLRSPMKTSMDGMALLCVRVHSFNSIRRWGRLEEPKEQREQRKCYMGREREEEEFCRVVVVVVNKCAHIKRNRWCVVRCSI